MAYHIGTWCYETIKGNHSFTCAKRVWEPYQIIHIQIFYVKICKGKAKSGFSAFTKDGKCYRWNTKFKSCLQNYSTLAETPEFAQECEETFL